MEKDNLVQISLRENSAIRIGGYKIGKFLRHFDIVSCAKSPFWKKIYKCMKDKSALSSLNSIKNPCWI